MAFRLIRCTSCGHKLRPGSDLCGKCGEMTPALNRSIGVIQHLSIGLVVVLIVAALNASIAWPEASSRTSYNTTHLAR